MGGLDGAHGEEYSEAVHHQARLHPPYGFATYGSRGVPGNQHICYVFIISILDGVMKELPCRGQGIRVTGRSACPCLDFDLLL